jgi:phage-related protein
VAEKEVTIRIVGDAKSGQKAFADISVAADKTAGSLKTIATNAAGFAIGGALTQLPGLLMDGAKGAAEDETAMKSLAQAVTNAGGDFDKLAPAVEKAIKNGQELAFTDGETAKALQVLTEMTGSGEEALNRLGPAMDLARAKGISLEQASKLLGKVSDENTTALRKLGVVVEDGATAQDVLNQVDKQFSGQAGIYAESSAGQLAIAGQQAGEVAETFGTYLIPAISLAAQVMLLLLGVVQNQIVPAFASFLALIQPLVSLIGDNLMPIFVALSPLLAGAAVVIAGALVSAFVAWAAATWAQVAAALALNTAMLPWIALLAAIGIAIAALYLAWSTNFLGIQDITNTVIGFVGPYVSATVDAMKIAVEAALNAISAVWNVVFPAIQAIVETVFPIIATVATTYINILKTEIEIAINVVKWVFDNVFMPIQGIVSDVFSTIAGLVGSTFDPAMAAIGTAVDTVKWAFDNVFLPIQGIVEDVFNTIWDTVQSLWNGAGGAVSLIGEGVNTVKGFFTGIYDTMYGFGSSMVQGLIDGAESLIGVFEGVWDTISGIADKIISVKNLITSPSRLLRMRGQQMMQGLTLGVEDGVPAYMNVWGRVASVGNAAMSGGSVYASSGVLFNSTQNTSPGPSVENHAAPFLRSTRFAPAAQSGGMAQYRRGMMDHNGNQLPNQMNMRDIENAVARGVTRGLRSAQ